MAERKEKRYVRRKLKIKETSFVDKGANPGAHVLLVKNADLEDLEMSDIHKAASKFKAALAVQNFDEVREAMDKMLRAFSSAVFGIMFDSEVMDKNGEIKGVLDDFSAAMEGLTPMLSGEEVGKMEKEILSMFESFTMEETTVDKELQKKLDDLQKQVDTLGDTNKTLKTDNENLTKQLAETTAKLEKLNKAAQGGEVKLDKSVLSPEMLAYVEDLEKNAKQNTDRVTKLETAEKIRKIHTDLEIAEKVPFDKNQITDLLVKMTTEDRQVICKVLADASALIKAGGTGELGSTVDDLGTEDGALAKLSAKAEEIRKADPGITKEKAFVKATRELPEVYKEYRFGKQQTATQ